MAENLTPREHGDLVTGVMGGIERIEHARRTRRRAFAVVTATAAVAVVVSISAAVWLAPLPQQATPPTPTISATPTPTRTATPTPDPMATPPVSASPAGWVLRPDGLGPVELGMPLEQAAAEVGGMTLACAGAYYGFDSSLWIAGWQTDVVNSVEWYARDGGTVGPRTAEGIGIGSTIDEVRAAYPDGVDVNRQRPNIQAGKLFFQLNTDSGLVDGVGVTNTDVPWEYCG